MLSTNLHKLAEASPARVAAEVVRAAGRDVVAALQEVNDLRWRKDAGAGRGVDPELAETHDF